MYHYIQFHPNNFCLVYSVLDHIMKNTCRFYTGVLSKLIFPHLTLAALDLFSQEDNFRINPLQRGQREEIACAINCVNKNLNETDWYDGENSMRLMWINYDQSIKCALMTKTWSHPIDCYWIRVRWIMMWQVVIEWYELLHWILTLKHKCQVVYKLRLRRLRRY